MSVPECPGRLSQRVHQPWGLSATKIIGELPGFTDAVRFDNRLGGGALARVDQTVLLELEADLERLILVGGLPVLHGESPWPPALQAGTVVTPEAAQSLGAELRRLRSTRSTLRRWSASSGATRRAPPSASWAAFRTLGAAASGCGRCCLRSSTSTR